LNQKFFATPKICKKTFCKKKIVDLAAIFPKILAAWKFVNGQGFPHFFSQIVKFLGFLIIEGVGKKIC